MTDEAERFTAVYDACRQRVWAYAVSRAGRQIADEVVSETFTVAWRRFGELPDPPLPWLLGVARNVLRENFRAQARREAFAAEARGWLESGHLPGPAADDVADEVTDRLAVLRALASLGEEDRDVLILIAWQGLTPREAARVMGCSSAALRVRLHRARRRLQAAAGDPPSRRAAARPPVRISAEIPGIPGEEAS